MAVKIFMFWYGYPYQNIIWAVSHLLGVLVANYDYSSKLSLLNLFDVRNTVTISPIIHLFLVGHEIQFLLLSVRVSICGSDNN